VLTLNQIPAHCSRKSPHKIFKNKKIPLSYFLPVGNPVVVLSNEKKSKLDPRGKFGKLIGFNLKLKSYRILADNGGVINSKSIDFLD
jgi:hypothetical protein